MNTIVLSHGPLEDKLDVARPIRQAPSVIWRQMNAEHRNPSGWVARVALWFGPSVCADCGAPRGSDGRFLCESEAD